MSQTVESHPGCFPQYSVPPATLTSFQFLRHANLIPVSGSLYVLFSLPGMLFPQPLARPAPPSSPRFSRDIISFESLPHGPLITYAFPAHNHLDFFPSIYHHGPPVSEGFTSLWSVSPQECKFPEAEGTPSSLASASQAPAQYLVCIRLLTHTHTCWLLRDCYTLELWIFFFFNCLFVCLFGG